MRERERNRERAESSQRGEKHTHKNGMSLTLILLLMSLNILASPSRLKSRSLTCLRYVSVYAGIQAKRQVFYSTAAILVDQPHLLLLFFSRRCRRKGGSKNEKGEFSSSIHQHTADA